MGSKNDITRKEFLTLTFTLIGTTAVGAACSDNNNAADGGTAGTTGSGGRGGTTGGGGTTGSAGTTGTGGGGGTTAASCTDPLPETQVADTTGHTHTVTIHASALDATTAQMVDTSVVGTGATAHMHSVTLEPAQLTTLKGGGTVTVMSSIVMSHGHMFMISCH
jgi:hypothetical protein